MKRLGKGLADIIDVAPASGASFVTLRTDQIRFGRFQPRTTISEPALEELKASIRRSGIIEPIVVRPIAHGTYEVVAGERRLRAAQAIGLQDVPVVIKTLTDREALEVSLIENVQRQDLNPLEEAKGYARLLDEFGHTQEEIAAAVGKDRSTIANLLRLLALPEVVQHSLRDGALTLGHAKALLGVTDRAKQLELFRQILSGGLSVRQTEGLAGAARPAKRRRVRQLEAQWLAFERELQQRLGTKVRLLPRAKGGRIVIEYFSPEDFSRILEIVGVAKA